jgi:hypothetical protein
MSEEKLLIDNSLKLKAIESLLDTIAFYKDWTLDFQYGSEWQLQKRRYYGFRSVFFDFENCQSILAAIIKMDTIEQEILAQKKRTGDI